MNETLLAYDLYTSSSTLVHNEIIINSDLPISMKKKEKNSGAAIQKLKGKPWNGWKSRQINY